MTKLTFICLQLVCIFAMTTTKQELISALQSAQDVQNEVSAPVLKPVMQTLRSMLSESDKIDVQARRLVALAVHADTDSAPAYVGLSALVESRTQLLRDQQDRLVGFPAITGG